MSRQLSAPTPKVRRLSIVAPVAKGGTGADNTVDAATSLGAINSATIGVAGGPAKVQVGGTVDPNNFPPAYPRGATVDGPTDFYVSATHTMSISNYDVASDASYAVTASAGTISRSGAIITFVAPATPQTVTLTIGSRTVTLNVKTAVPLTPSIVTPTMTAVNQPASLTVTSSAFQIPTGTPSHQFSDWELSTDSGFVNVIQSSFNDTVNKTSWLISGLGTNTTYYLRTRQKDTNLGYSAWSPTSSFTTKLSFTITGEEAKLIASDKANSDLFGWSCAMSRDGTRLAVGAYMETPGGTANAGAVYVYVRDTTLNTWTQEQKLNASDKVASDNFGYSVAIDSTGTRIAVGAWHAGSGNSVGAAYIFSRSGTTWTQEQKLTAADGASNYVMGRSIALDATATRVFVGAPGALNGGTAAGAVYVYLRTNTTWAIELKVLTGDPVSSGQFGRSVACDSSGARFIAGAPVVGTGGAAYVFIRTGTTWNQEFKYIPTVAPASGDTVGLSVAMCGDGSRAVVGGPAYTVSSVRSGAAFIITRVNVTWTEEATIAATDKAASDTFGQSVSIDSTGVRIAVGTPLADPNTITNGGATYVFSRNTTTNVWSQESKLIASDNLGNANYGQSVTCDQYMTRVVSGASSATAGGTTSAGACYVCA